MASLDLVSSSDPKISIECQGFPNKSLVTDDKGNVLLNDFGGDIKEWYQFTNTDKTIVFQNVSDSSKYLGWNGDAVVTKEEVYTWKAEDSGDGVYFWIHPYKDNKNALADEKKVLEAAHAKELVLAPAKDEKSKKQKWKRPSA